jgi:uncharacterized membrane protein
MPTTAWRFPSTESADEAVMRLKEFNEQDLVKVEDMTVVRWPHYAGAPAADEHVTVQGGALSSMVHKIAHNEIDSSMIDSVKEDLMPGTSALVLQSSSSSVLEALAQAVGGAGVQLMRSDLSVPEQDQLRALLEGPPLPPEAQPPGGLA